MLAMHARAAQRKSRPRIRISAPHPHTSTHTYGSCHKHLHICHLRYLRGYLIWNLLAFFAFALGSLSSMVNLFQEFAQLLSQTTSQTSRDQRVGLLPSNSLRKLYVSIFCMLLFIYASFSFLPRFSVNTSMNSTSSTVTSTISNIPTTSTSSEDKPKHLAFIYGTLKNDFPNWQFMPAPRLFAGVARTVQPYPLVTTQDLYLPFLVNASNPAAKRVYGELYYVNDLGLEFLDDFEGVSQGFYIREVTDVEIVKPGHLDCKATPDVRFDIGSIQSASTYFRHPSNLGPPYAHKWTIESLQQLPMLERYPIELTRYYVRRGDRKRAVKTEDSK